MSDSDEIKPLFAELISKHPELDLDHSGAINTSKEFEATFKKLLGKNYKTTLFGGDHYVSGAEAGVAAGKVVGAVKGVMGNDTDKGLTSGAAGVLLNILAEQSGKCFNEMAVKGMANGIGYNPAADGNFVPGVSPKKLLPIGCGHTAGH